MSTSPNPDSNIKVNFDEIPKADIDVGCSVLASCVRRFFEQPGVKEEYEAWMMTEEGRRAELPRKKRMALDRKAGVA